MKIAIDISKELYQKIKETNMFEIKSDKSIYSILLHAVYAGVPLHGRLIDANEAEKIADKMFERITNPLLNHIQTYDAYNIIRLTPTIIETDTMKSEGDEKNG